MATVTLTFDLQHLIGSSLSPSGNSVEAILRYHVHKHEMDVQTYCMDGLPENTMLMQRHEHVSLSRANDTKQNSSAN